MGYPGVGGETITVTNGIISGFEGIHIKTSAKISYGNSGGAAIHKTGCFLGIPTEFKKIGSADLVGYIIDERIGGQNPDNNNYVDASSYLTEALNKNQTEKEINAKEKELLSIFLNDYLKVASHYNNFTALYKNVFNYTRNKDYAKAYAEIEKMKTTTQNALSIINGMNSSESYKYEMNQIKDGLKVVWNDAGIQTVNGLTSFVYYSEEDAANNYSTQYGFKAYDIAYSWYKDFVKYSEAINEKYMILKNKAL